jgi:hypothetical protein
MSIDRLVLGLSSAFLLVAGVACVVSPASFAEQAGLSTAPSALTEIRAFYGGIEIGLGCFLIWCLRHRTLTEAGLVLVALTVGSAGIGRFLGMLIDRQINSYHLVNLAVEITTVALVIVAFTRLRDGSS